MDYIEYLAGYTMALMLSLSAAISVASYMASNTSLPFMLVSTVSCLILNLILFWRSFDSILKLPEYLNKENTLPIFLTFNASIITYAFTLLTFFDLGASFPIIQIMFPLPLIHLIALGCAVGTFGLYIESCIKLGKTDISQQPLFEMIGGMLLTAAIIVFPDHALSLCVLLSLLTYITVGLGKLFRVLAITASLLGSYNGMAGAMPLILSMANSYAAFQVLRALSLVGLSSLSICDALFSLDVVESVAESPPEFTKPAHYAFLGLAACNAAANSQITADGKGFFQIEALFGGLASLFTMIDSTKDIPNEKDPNPPFAPQKYLVISLFLYNYLLFKLYSSWLRFAHPSTHNVVASWFSKPVVPGIKRSIVATGALVAAHYTLLPNEDHTIVKEAQA